VVLLIQSVKLKPGMNDFAVLGTNYVYLLRNLIGLFDVLHVLSMVYHHHYYYYYGNDYDYDNLSCLYIHIFLCTSERNSVV